MPHLCGLAREAASVVVSDPHQPVRLVKWQRTNQQRVHNTKDSRACANAKSDDKNRESSEPRITPQRPEGVANILEQRISAPVHHVFGRTIVEEVSPIRRSACTRACRVRTLANARVLFRRSTVAQRASN